MLQILQHFVLKFFKKQAIKTNKASQIPTTTHLVTKALQEPDVDLSQINVLLE